MTFHHDETLCGPERIPFRAVIALFAMGAMTFFQGIFFQAEMLNIGIVAAHWQGSQKKQLSAHPHFTGCLDIWYWGWTSDYPTRCSDAPRVRGVC